MPIPKEPTAYDQVRYPSYTHPPAHPDRLAVRAVLYGLDPPPVASCRVLELGCGDGSNLVPMAFGLPGGNFVGLDLSTRAIERGREMIADLGLENVELRQGDILSVDGTWGQFDYIIAHGVYSWVPPEVREKILSICGSLLTPQGVAFISYLAYPGAYVRAMMRDLMLFRAGEVEDPAKLNAAGREAAELIAATSPAGDFVQRTMQAEAERILKSVPDFLYHDDLSEWSAPYYFAHFANDAARHGLQYLAEADQTEMQHSHLTESVQEQLLKLSGNRIEREQYLDFIRARRFRQTLLCRSNLTVNENAGSERLAGLLVASAATGPEGEIDLQPGVEVAFISPRGPKLDTSYAAGKAAMAILVEAWPLRLPLAEITAEVRSRLAAAGIEHSGTEQIEKGLHEFLLKINAVGVVDFHTDPTGQVTKLSERPVASPVARWQLQQGTFATSLQHFGLTFNDKASVLLLPLLDGTRDFATLVGEIKKANLKITATPEVSDFEDLEADLLRERLDYLAKQGFLIG